MCGICGLIQFGRKYGTEQMEKTVHKMNGQMVHRGPDHEGLYADEFCSLGMRRLSIIDLDGGNQPVWNRDRTMMLVFNGEIYNYKNLRKQLQGKGYRFYTKSDSETVIAGYERYGTDFFKFLEGMFAFCIYDLKQKIWIFARDRIGEKPLYYYKGKDCFLFSSELKSIMSSGLVPKKIDSAALSQFFQLTYIPSPQSIYENVKKLQPAAYMVLKEDGSIQKDTFWHLDVNGGGEYRDYEWCKKKLRESLFASVEKRMISDVPLGAFLSGGFDSTVIAGIMSAISERPVRTFTIGFHEKQYDESDMAAIVAKKHHTDHTVLKLDWNTAFEELDTVLNDIDEPLANPTLIATYQVSKLARQHVAVTLTGDAGDELFAGYDKYLIAYYTGLYERVPAFLRKGIAEPVIKRLPAGSTIYRKANKVISNAGRDIYEQRKRVMCLGFKEEEISKLLPDIPVDSMNFIKRQYFRLKGEDEQKRTQYVDLNTALEGCMLSTVDRGSMLASLETRIPFLDTAVIETAFRMPTEFKINRTARKLILKDTFKDMIPEELFHFPKHGFSVPIGRWLSGELGNRLKEYADREFIKEQGLFSYDYIQRMITNHMNRTENRDRELWAFFVFQNWYEREVA